MLVFIGLINLLIGVSIMQKIIKSLSACAMAISIAAPSLAFAEDFYFRSGPSLNLIMLYNTSGKNVQKIFSAIDMVGGVDLDKYSYELGYTTSLPKNIGYDYGTDQKIKIAFSNLHLDLNRNVNYSYNLNFRGGVGAGLLNTKAFSSKYDFDTLSRTETSRFTQSLQARANIGAQYILSKELHLNADLSGQAGSIYKPMLIATGININYMF